jgi:hypothetical protein
MPTFSVRDLVAACVTNTVATGDAASWQSLASELDVRSCRGEPAWQEAAIALAFRLPRDMTLRLQRAGLEWLDELVLGCGIAPLLAETAMFRGERDVDDVLCNSDSLDALRAVPGLFLWACGLAAAAGAGALPTEALAEGILTASWQFGWDRHFRTLRGAASGSRGE